MASLLRAGLGTLLLALTLPVLVTVSATPAHAIAPERYQAQIRTVTNNRRDAHDLATLRKGACVQRWADRHARRMANQERMFHQDIGRVMRRCGLSSVGENVAYGYSNGRAVVRAWMNSQGHRANILNRGFQILGASARQGDSGAWYAVQVFGRS